MGHLEDNFRAFAMPLGHLQGHLGHLEGHLGHSKGHMGHLEGHLGVLNDWDFLRPLGTLDDHFGLWMASWSL